MNNYWVKYNKRESLIHLVEMSLKPKRVNFNETWQDLKDTIKEVITLGNVKRDIWNNRFGYV